MPRVRDVAAMKNLAIALVVAGLTLWALAVMAGSRDRSCAAPAGGQRAQRGCDNATFLLNFIA
jgi:hypothetical protein